MRGSDDAIVQCYHIRCRLQITDARRRLTCLQVSALNNLINTVLVNIESSRNELIGNLTDIRNYIGNINFTATGLTLDSAQQELNANGSEIVGKFINDTGDAIYDAIVQFSDQIVYAIENTVAVCSPLSDAFSDMIDSFCVKTVSFKRSSHLFSHI